LGEHETLELLQASSPRSSTTFFRRDPSGAAVREGAATGAILLVDDDPANRDMLSRRLTRLGYTVTTAANGREALQILRTAPFVLMLLDIQRRERNVSQALETMQAAPPLQRLPVIVLSASDKTKRIPNCIQLGAENSLPNPFDPVLLQARL